jgi:U4/U6 small nuclear ribonucleoprotein PRP31
MFSAKPSTAEELPAHANPEYSLIVTANNLSVELENEIMIVHKVSLRVGDHYCSLSIAQFVRDHYATKFPELEQLIPDPTMYMRTVRALANHEVNLLSLV